MGFLRNGKSECLFEKNTGTAHKDTILKIKNNSNTSIESNASTVRVQDKIENAHENTKT